MPFSLSLDRCVASAHVVTRDVGGTTVLLNTERGEYFTLDDVGTRVWLALMSAPSMRAAHEQLLGEYEISPEELVAELSLLFDELERRGLITVQSQ